VSAADIDHVRMPAEIIRLRYRIVGARAERDHRLLEERGLVRMIRQPIETGFAERSFEYRFPGANAIREPPEREIRLTALSNKIGADASRYAFGATRRNSK
jgi:hypothetical protein